MGTTLRKIEEKDLEMIMNWRMDPDITRYMNTDPKLTIEGQREWLKRIETDDKVLYWLIEADGVPAGVICLIEIDWENKTSSWGYYIGEKKCRSLKMALSLEMSLYDFVFDELGFDSLHNEVFALNKGVIKLHEACGSRIESIGQGEVTKNGEAFDIAHINITKEEWDAIRAGRHYEKVAYTMPLRVHHIGYAVNNLENSIQGFKRLGYHEISEICEDTERKIAIIFMKHSATGETVELVTPMENGSPVDGQLQRMKQMAAPYHICYEVVSIEKIVPWLKKRGFVPIDKPSAAPAIDGRRVTFLVQKDVGMIELVEQEQRGC